MGHLPLANKGNTAPVQKSEEKAGTRSEERSSGELLTSPVRSAAQLIQMQKSAGNHAVMQMLKAKQQASKVIQREEANSKKDADMAKFKQRCQQYAQVLDSSFVDLFERYINCLVANNKDEGKPLFDAVIAHLNKIKAFEIPAAVYNDVKDPAEAEKYTQNVNLWSKTNKHMPNEKAAASGGITLESSLAGFLFDGLGFGVDYSTSDLLQEQWREVSRNFVKNAKGVVNAHMLIGVTKASVLYRTEAGIIQEKMDKGEVTKVIVHYYKAVLKGPVDFEMEKFDEKEITTPEAWKELLKQTQATVPIGEVKTPSGPKTVVAKIDPNGNVFKTIQDFTHKAEEKRHEAK